MAENSGDLSLGYMMGQSEGNNSGGFGNFSEGLWGVIILALLFGRGGFGGFGGGDCGCATQADVRAAVDQQTLISKLDQQTYGLADSTYALNNTIVNGFHATQRSLDNIRYDAARESCDTRRAIADSARDIIDNQNANYRGLMDFMVQSKIDALQSENDALRLSASQAKQNQYLIDQLRPCPVPAYSVPAPFYYGRDGSCSCGCGY